MIRSCAERSAHAATGSSVCCAIFAIFCTGGVIGFCSDRTYYSRCGVLVSFQMIHKQQQARALHSKQQQGSCMLLEQFVQQ
eukprot:13688-Heterococcus_DN1.PRE.3